MSSRSLAFFLDIPLLAHPLYSPDLAPAIFFLFPRLKTELSSWNIRNLEQLKFAVKKELNAIPPQEYCAAVRQMLIHWMKCVVANGSYFEGRHFHIDPSDYSLEMFFESLDEPQDSDGSLSKD